MDLKDFWAAADATFPGDFFFFFHFFFFFFLSSFSLSWTKGTFPVLGSQCSELNMPAGGLDENHLAGGPVR